MQASECPNYAPQPMSPPRRHYVDYRQMQMMPPQPLYEPMHGGYPPPRRQGFRRHFRPRRHDRDDTSVAEYRRETWIKRLCEAGLFGDDDHNARDKFRRYIDYVVEYNAHQMQKYRAPFYFETLMRMSEDYLRSGTAVFMELSDTESLIRVLQFTMTK